MKRCLATLLVVGLLASCGTPSRQLADAALEARRDELAFSMLVINLRDLYNEPMEPVSRGGISWRERYNRAAQWIASQPEPPDALVIQEMPGMWRNGLLKDYEAVQYLLDQINTRRTPKPPVDYRIAYLLSHKMGGGHGDWPIGENKYGTLPTRGGRALLYRPDRVRNTQTAAGLPFDQGGVSATELFNSIPCCDTSPTPFDRRICAKIDGPAVTATSPSDLIPPPWATCSTPAGAAFTRRNAKAPDWPNGNMEAVFTRLELVRQPGNFVHLYNVHNSREADSEATILRLVEDMELRFGPPASTGRLYPPILAGDFNLDRAAIERSNPPPPFPRFDVLHWSPALIGVLIGAEQAFPSRQKVLLRQALDLPANGCMPSSDPARWPPVPSDPQTLWSDHCASLYLHLVPVYDRPN